MNIVVPDPPVDPDPESPRRFLVSAADIAAATASGRVGYCVMCRGITTRWWDLTACDLEPVTDRSGILTDQVALDDTCVVALIDYWVSIVAGPGGADGRLDGPDVPPDDVRDDEPARDESATRPRTSRADRLALLGGVYGGSG